MIKEWIAEYGPKNEEEILSTLREIMQEITLTGLSRTDFYEKAAFYGGTALRIFYALIDFQRIWISPYYNLIPIFPLSPISMI